MPPVPSVAGISLLASGGTTLQGSSGSQLQRQCERLSGKVCPVAALAPQATAAVRPQTGREMSVLPILQPVPCTSSLHPQGGRSQAGRAAVVALQMAAAAAIIGILAVGAVGVQIDRTSVAQDCEWCQDFACLDVPYWTCNSTASAVQPTPNCGLVTFGNGTATLRCPQVCALATALQCGEQRRCGAPRFTL